jgi:uncharacterized protein involved in type VI secretion and phage assembly
MDLGGQLFRQLHREQVSGERVAGAVIGIVTGNQDPDQLGRVQVRLPMFATDDSTWWAPVVSIGAGKNRGWFFVPEIDDEVVVMFEHGDVNHPVVVGAVWNDRDEPADQNDGANERRVIRSRAGSRLIFDDDQGKLIIEDGGGAGRITLDAKANSITLEALAGDVSLQAPSGDFIAVADKAVIKAGANLTLVSDADTQLDADSGLKLSGSGDVKLSGADVHFNTSGKAKGASKPSTSPQDVPDPFGS